MALVTVGVSHKSTPVAVRSQLAFAPAHIESALASLKKSGLAKEAAILSTCNRTELYAYQASVPELLDWWGLQAKAPELITQHAYSLTHSQAVTHMMRVASGLESMVLGEPQILGQLKTAFNHASDAETTGRVLNRLFQSSFQVAKRVRSETEIGQNTLSVAYAAVRLAQGIFSDLPDLHVMIIGAGETAQLVARHFQQLGVSRFYFANRSLSNAERLAQEFQGKAYPLSECQSLLTKVDIVVSSTAAIEPIVTKAMMDDVTKERRHRPLFMVDLAVPADIERRVGEHPDTYLYTVDDLSKIVSKHYAIRQSAADIASRMIADESDRFYHWLDSEQAFAAIKALRQRLDADTDVLLAQAKQRLNSGQSAEAVLDLFAHQLKQRYLHHPSVRLREAGLKRDNELIGAVRTLYDLENA